jgi:hypothetical protein
MIADAHLYDSSEPFKYRLNFLRRQEPNQKSYAQDQINLYINILTKSPILIT